MALNLHSAGSLTFHQTARIGSKVEIESGSVRWQLAIQNIKEATLVETLLHWLFGRIRPADRSIWKRERERERERERDVVKGSRWTLSRPDSTCFENWPCSGEQWHSIGCLSSALQKIEQFRKPYFKSRVANGLDTKFRILEIDSSIGRSSRVYFDFH